MKRQSVHVFELRQYSDLSHIKEPNNGILLFEFLLKWLNLKAEGPETLFHIRSNLLCLLCRCFVSFLFALRCIFHCVRTWFVVWEQHCLSVMATVTKGGRVLRTDNWNQSLFKTSHVTRRPSLKRLSGIQVQLLLLCMGKHQILQNCSLSLRLNFMFEITNEIGQQLCHKCCFFCSNSVIKSLFLRLDQPVCMCSPEHVSEHWLFL